MCSVWQIMGLITLQLNIFYFPTPTDAMNSLPRK